MCKRQKVYGAVLAAVGVGLLLGLLIGSAVLDFFVAAGLILGGVFLLIR